MGTTVRLQANALIRKNAVYQRRAICTNLCLLSAPIVFSVLLFIMQLLINTLLISGDDYKCGCKCLQCCPPNGACFEAEGHCPFKCKKTDGSKCGFRYSSYKQAVWCPIKHPDSYPPLLQLPKVDERAQPWRPNFPIFYTAKSPAVAAALGKPIIPEPDVVRMVTVVADFLENPTLNATGEVDQPMQVDVLGQMGLVLATASTEQRGYYKEMAFVDTEYPLEVVLPATLCNQVLTNTSQNVTFMEFFQKLITTEVKNLTSSELKQFNAALKRLPADLLSTNTTASAAADPSTSSADRQKAALAGMYTANPLVLLAAVNVNCRNAYAVEKADTAAIDRTLFCGFYKARCDGKPTVSSYPLAYDFKDSTQGALQLDIIHNDTARLENNQGGPGSLQRITLPLSMAVNSWIKWALGPEYSAELQGVMSTPKRKSKLELDFSSLLGPLFYCWVVQMLLPTFLVQLVYEKEKRLRMMMKMHGLGDAAYWGVTYLWYFTLYLLYIIIYLVFGSAIGLNIFRVNSYGIQIIFYLLFGNCMIAFSFLLSCFFTSSRTAVVVAFLYVFGSGLIGNLLLEQFMAKSYDWMFFVQWIPAFSLYRGLYELSQYAFLGVYRDSDGMMFSNLSDARNGMVTTWGIFLVQWVLFMVLAWYLEQVYASGTGIRRHPLFFLDRFRKKVAAEPRATRDSRASKEFGGMDMSRGDLADVVEERERVAALTDLTDYPIVVKDIKKVYPGLDGGKPKLAVRNLSLAVERGECFGLLGPNGAGKSTSINMMTGFLEPSSGTAIIAGQDIRRSMNEVYKIMGVCPQHDLLWDTLTGREHLLFYGRLKGLTGPELQGAVNEALKSVNLANLDHKQSRQYSGGMKRRLSVAISFVGDPAVVYLDEPSTGLDPASRRNLWDVVRTSKRGRAIILTTHSMEEAEMLCDRLGIFVDGQLVCIGNPKEITSRYGSYYVFSIQVPPEQEDQARQLVASMSPSSKMTYAVGGALKFEMPKDEVTLGRVFDTMSNSSRHGLQVLDWGVANATLEEVFIKFARQIGATTAEMSHEEGANGVIKAVEMV